MKIKLSFLILLSTRFASSYLRIMSFNLIPRRLFGLTSLRQLSAAATVNERACFGAGCFWGTEKFFKKDIKKLCPDCGIIDGKVGYMGPPQAKENPTYREVCTGQTGHVEVFDVNFTGGDRTFEYLCRHFFTFHDPTTLNRQGNDVGSQYASVIYCYTDEQITIAERVRHEIQQLLDKKIIRYSGPTVLTEIKRATVFYSAEDEHQRYLDKNPGGYCNHFYRVDPDTIIAWSVANT